MATTDIFEKGTRLKVTFAFRGTLSLYDLWDLKLEELDVLYRALNKESKNAASEGDGLMGTRKTKADAILDLKKEIVKHVFTVLSAEKDKRNAQAVRKQKTQELMAILAEKEGEALKGMSREEIRKQLDELNMGDDDE